jgi:hypothetical protein
MENQVSPVIIPIPIVLPIDNAPMQWWDWVIVALGVVATIAFIVWMIWDNHHG